MSIYNFNTPEVPAEIRQIWHPQYKNIYEYDLGNQNLWGTETLLGDWDGEYLLIAKDFYPSSYIEKAMWDGISQPYRHNPSAPTNRNLIKTLAHFGRYSPGSTNTNCGFLYTSACFLLRADEAIRGALPDEARVLELSHPVLRFTLDNMPNLKHVVLMGNEAARSVEQTLLLGDLNARHICIHRVSHPSRAMSDDDRFREWEAVFNGTRSNAMMRTAQKPVAPSQSSGQHTRESSMSSKDLVLEHLSTTPQSVEQLMRLTGLSNKDVRNGIDALRRQYCVWLDSSGGFWIDNPISQKVPAAGAGRWRRNMGT